MTPLLMNLPLPLQVKSSNSALQILHLEQKKASYETRATKKQVVVSGQGGVGKASPLDEFPLGADVAEMIVGKEKRKENQRVL